VLALFALVLGMSTFALRETLRDVEETAPAAGAPPSRGGRIAAILFRLWTRCLVIGLLGSIPAYGAATASAAWPFAAGALALLVLHAPRRGLLEIRRR